METETRSDDSKVDGDLVQQRSENRENSHQCGQASDDDEPVESYDALDICIEVCKFFSHLCHKFCGLIGDFSVELVEFLIHIFHCAVFLQSFQGAVKARDNYRPQQLWERHTYVRRLGRRITSLGVGVGGGG